MTNLYGSEKDDCLEIVKDDIKEYLIKAGISDALAITLLGTVPDGINNVSDLITIIIATASAFYGFGTGLTVCILLGELMRIRNNYSYLYDKDDLHNYRKQKKLLLKK